MYIYLLSFPHRQGILFPNSLPFQSLPKVPKVPLTHLTAKSPTGSWNTIKPAESPQTLINPPGHPAWPGSSGLDPGVCFMKEKRKKKIAGHKMEVMYKSPPIPLLPVMILCSKRALLMHMCTLTHMYCSKTIVNVYFVFFSQPP